jgi:hypothetical protein
MPESEKEIAREVHELLLTARPERDDPNLIKASLFQSAIPASSLSPRKDEVFAAIKNLRTATEKGASADQGERLLLDAIHAAEHWATDAEPG